MKAEGRDAQRRIGGSVSDLYSRKVNGKIVIRGFVLVPLLTCEADKGSHSAHSSRLVIPLSQFAVFVIS